MKTTKRARKYLLWVRISKMRESIQQNWEKLLSKEIEKQMFTDELVYGTTMIHVDNTETRRIVPYSTEYWNIKDKIEYNKHVEKYGYPPPSSTQVTIMTIDEIKEKYDISNIKQDGKE